MGKLARGVRRQQLAIVVGVAAEAAVDVVAAAAVVVQVVRAVDVTVVCHGATIGAVGKGRPRYSRFVRRSWAVDARIVVGVLTAYWCTK